MIAGGGYTIYDQRQVVAGAEEVDAVVLETSMEPVSPSEAQPEWRVDIRYEYTYVDETYERTSIWASRGTVEFEGRSGARGFLEDYPEDETGTAYVDPDDPSKSFLTPAAAASVSFELVIAGGVLVVVAMLWKVGKRVAG